MTMVCILLPKGIKEYIVDLWLVLSVRNMESVNE